MLKNLLICTGVLIILGLFALSGNFLYIYQAPTEKTTAMLTNMYGEEVYCSPNSDAFDNCYQYKTFCISNLCFIPPN
jgi:hypothetical protein